jgi:hypothetical protein
VHDFQFDYYQTPPWNVADKGQTTLQQQMDSIGNSSSDEGRINDCLAILMLQNLQLKQEPMGIFKEHKNTCWFCSVSLINT